MIQNGVDIIILQEHWLWPYELSSLSSIHPQYEFTAISDKRLHSGSDLERGCGGVAILWNKALTCIPISALDSDRVCGVYMSSIPSAKGHLRRCLTILGVYMPSADKSQEINSSYLETVEHAVSQFTDDGPLLVMGDFNAHLGNQQQVTQQACDHRGRQWLSFIDAHSLHNILLSSLTTGPAFTYSSGDRTSTIDYVLGNDDALRGLSSCVILEDHPLNTSDHLAILCTLDLAHLRHPAPFAFPPQPLDWNHASMTGATTQYAKTCDDIIRPLLGKDYFSIEEVDADLKFVCKEVTEAAISLVEKKKIKQGGIR